MTTPGRARTICSTAQRGAAMLLALAALAIVVPAGVGALRGASARAVESSAALDEERVRLAALSLGPVLVAWAADQDGPGVAAQDRAGLLRILDRGAPDGSRLVVEAIDLSGRLHLDALGTLAAAGLPAPLDRLTLQESDRTATADSATVPLMPETIAWAVSHESGRSVPSFPLPTAGNEADLQPSIVLWITGHGRKPGTDPRSQRSTAAQQITALNIHTAPIELLRAALVGYDPALARAALACRERNEPIPPEVAGSLVATSNNANRSINDAGKGWRLTPLTTRSDAYGFLVSVDRGANRVSWWIVAERSAPAGRRAGSTIAGRGPVTGWAITERRRVHP